MGIVQVMNNIHDEYPEDEFWHFEKRGENTNSPSIDFAATTAPVNAPKPAPNEDTSPANKEEEIYEKEYFVYIVRKGDSLYKIAKRFPKNRISNIRINNSLSSDILYPGMTILLEK
jgi:LysM repeat protein